jgi:hypothetical protein
MISFAAEKIAAISKTFSMNVFETTNDLKKGNFHHVL